jgi:hypothetical protein
MLLMPMAALIVALLPGHSPSSQVVHQALRPGPFFPGRPPGKCKGPATFLALLHFIPACFELGERCNEVRRADRQTAAGGVAGPHRRCWPRCHQPVSSGALCCRWAVNGAARPREEPARLQGCRSAQTRSTLTRPTEPALSLHARQCDNWSLAATLHTGRDVGKRRGKVHVYPPLQAGLQ